ncbi:MAG TPA: NAD(+) synthase [Flavobacteriales bacterium]|nr:NAD(+) synthase [Flavobacteriales bacterium]|tara:strand:- start:7070 stop:7846 length:777 start_codon:yes stop_codon:yes gene_type:complete
MDALVQHIVSWLEEYANDAGMDGWVVGVSGGVDSAVTSTLCAKTGLPTCAVEMPIHQHPDHVSRAQDHIQSLEQRFGNVSRARVDLTGVYDELVCALPTSFDNSGGLALANSRARLRMTALYAVASQRSALVVGTGNKVEDFGVGFYTKYGDGGVDISPIADLIKTEVFALGAFLGVGKEILDASPTDGLWGDDRTDENQLGATYPELEWAMSNMDADTSDWTARQHEVMGIYSHLNRVNQHKMNPIPVCLIPEFLRM